MSQNDFSFGEARSIEYTTESGMQNVYKSLNKSETDLSIFVDLAETFDTAIFKIYTRIS